MSNNNLSMGSTSSEKVQLTAIVPISRMAGKLSNFRYWFNSVNQLPMRIVIVHDFADDETSTEIREIIASSPQTDIRFLEGVFGGPGMARNAGLSEATSEWVCFWDSDDLPDVDIAMSMIMKADIRDEVLIGDFQIIHAEGVSEAKLVSHRNEIQNIATNPGLWRMIFRRSSIGQLQFENNLMGEDQVFLAQYNLASRRILFLNELVYSYVKGTPGQLTFNQSAIDGILKSFQMLLRIFELNAGKNENFTSILVLRTLFTGLTKGSSPIKSSMLREFFGGIHRRPRLLLFCFRNLFIVFSRRA